MTVIDTPNRSSRLVLLSLTLLTAFEGLVGVLVLLAIPSDPKNALAFGFSAARLALLGGMLTLVLLWFGIFIKLKTKPKFEMRVFQKIADLAVQRRFSLPLTSGLVMLIFVAILTLVKSIMNPDHLLSPQLVRLTPVVCWIGLFSLQTLMFLLYMKSAQRSKQGLRLTFGKTAAFLLVAVAVLVPRAVKLDSFATVDEEKWAVRAANFYTGMRTRDFARTYQSEHPGVMTMWAGAVGINLTLPEIHKHTPEQLKAKNYSNLLTKLGSTLFEMMIAGRLVLIFIHTALLLLVFRYLLKLIEFVPAFAAVILISFDPFHLAHSRLLHLDGLLSTLMFVSLLGFFTCLENPNRDEYILAGITTGMTWLTKSTGFFLGPAFILIWLIWLYNKNKGLSGFRKFQVNLVTARPLLYVFGLAGLTYFVLWPAMWVNPIESLASIFDKAFNYAAEGHENPLFFNGLIYPDGKIGFLSVFYPVTYLWRTSPIILAGLIAAGIAILFSSPPFNRPELRRLATVIVVFTVTFGILINLGDKKFDRYLLPIYLPLDLLGFFGLHALCNILSRIWGIIKKTEVSLLVYALLLLISTGQGGLTLSHAPYFLTYYNPLLGGIDNASEVMMIGWGEGLDQAAKYLNGVQKDDPLNVFTWYNSAFNPFFIGTASDITGDYQVKSAELEDILNADYAVIYIHQWQRNIPQALLEILNSIPPEHIIRIRGINYVKVYNLGSLK